MYVDHTRRPSLSRSTAVAQTTSVGGVVDAVRETSRAHASELLNMRKQGTAELTSTMLANHLAGLLWYGRLIDAAPVIAASAVAMSSCQ
jgi:hypothetical protein